MSGRTLRYRLGVGLLATVAAIALLGVPVGPGGPVVVRAAAPDLTITSAADYDVQPDQQRVQVTLDLKLTNHLKDTKTRRFYFDEAFLAVLPGTSGFKLTWDGTGTPEVRASKKTRTYTMLRMVLAKRLYSGKSATYRLTFNLKDPGGVATRELRIGDSLVSFPVWAFATDATPGSSVSVSFPPGFEVAAQAGSIPPPTTDADGRTVFDSGRLERPLDFFAYLVADRPGAYTEKTVTAQVAQRPATIIVRSWPDDEPWAERISGLLRDGLPAMGRRVGLDWPHDDPLVVQEAVSRSTGGYAGLFDPSAGKVEIAYYADDVVVLHEAAHSWFNGSLLADRWANEAFASYYALEVAADIGVKATTDALTEELQAARIPLNAWGPVGTEDVTREDYAYAASLVLARTIAARAGDDGLRDVWADAASLVGAYRPAIGDPELVDAAPDWRGLLDVLEERTAATYDDLWRTWVARPADLPLLDARAAARERLAQVTAVTDGWHLPRPIRDSMRAWQFADATTWLDAADASLDQRAAVEAAATRAGVIAPDTLRTAFEDDDGFDDALAEATAELETIGRYDAATATRPTEATPVVSLGLWGETPEADLVMARDALARGDLDASVAASAEAASIWSSAESVGQGRAVSIALLIVAALLAIGLLVGAWRRRHDRRQRSRLPMARQIQPD